MVVMRWSQRVHVLYILGCDIDEHGRYKLLCFGPMECGSHCSTGKHERNSRTCMKGKARTEFCACTESFDGKASSEIELNSLQHKVLCSSHSQSCSNRS